MLRLEPTMAYLTFHLVLGIRRVFDFVLCVTVCYHQLFRVELLVAFATYVHFLANFVDLFNDFLPLVIVLQMHSQVVGIREISRTLFARM